MPALLRAVDAKEDGESMTDTSKLRETPENEYVVALLNHAADRIDNLERQRDELEDALRKFMNIYPNVRALHLGFLENSNGGTDWDKHVERQFMEFGKKVHALLAKIEGEWK